MLLKWYKNILTDPRQPQSTLTANKDLSQLNAANTHTNIYETKQNKRGKIITGLHQQNRSKTPVKKQNLRQKSKRIGTMNCEINK